MLTPYLTKAIRTMFDMSLSTLYCVADARLLADLFDSQPLEENPQSSDLKSENASPKDIVSTQNDHSVVPNQQLPEMPNCDRSFDQSLAQQSLLTFFEDVKTRMTMFDQLMKTRMEVFDQALFQTNQSIKILELVVCENHNMKTLKSVELMEQQMMAEKDGKHNEPHMFNTKLFGAHGKEAFDSEASAQQNVNSSTLTGPTHQTTTYLKKTTNLKDLVIDVTDDDYSNDLHEFAIADSEDDIKGPFKNSSSEQPKDKGKRIFDSRKHPTTNVDLAGKATFPDSPFRPSKKKQKTNIVTPSFSLGGNSGTKKAWNSGSGKGTRPSGKARGVTLPKPLKTAFRPTADMDLTTKEAQVFAYVFAEGMDINEVLLSMGDIFVTRQEFYCFVPGRPISAKEEVLEGKELDFMIEKYARRWIHASDGLKFLKEAHVRVKTPLALLMGPYNLMKRQVEAYALSKWSDYK
ncbi:hypothetical protein RIF29_29806 [Crotalaria pallida]|uniref:Uncharacterized protein n=1 Tax=Crotalaria pallida TaxID=3830 RepID=A0AAN9EF75_CROPI